MPAFFASDTITIRQNIDDVYAFLRDLNNWPDWSPWLSCDPDAKVGVGNTSFSWESELSGRGELEIHKEYPHTKIEFELKMKRPWGAKSQVEITLEEVGDSTKVTWSRSGKLPIFLFWMKEVVEQLTSLEYRRGLKMLKDLLETGKINSTVDFLGKQKVEGCYYVGVERHCAIESMEIALREDFEMLMDWVKEQPSSLVADASQHMFTLYDKWDLKHGVVHYRICHPVKQLVESVPHGFVRGKRDDCNARVVGHTGAYKHLGNAWAAAMLRSRGRIFQSNSKHKPFEKYTSFPSDVGEQSTVTLVCIPTK